MALTASEVRSFGFGHIYAAPVGTTEPAEIDDPVDTGDWTELGHGSDTGPRFSFGKARTPVSSWQSFPNAVRNLKGAAATTVSYDLLQWNAETIAYALGDSGSWTDSGGGLYTYEPGDPGDVDERAIIVEATDGDCNYRFIFRRTENQANVDFAWTGSALAPLPVVATVLTPDGEDKPYIIQTDDPAIVVVGS